MITKLICRLTRGDADCLVCDTYSIEKVKKPLLAWKESYQWLKIIGLTIALGVMVYQTYLLKIISDDIK